MPRIFSFRGSRGVKKIFWIANTGGYSKELLGLENIFENYKSQIFTEKTDSTKILKEKYGKKTSLFYF